MSIESNDTDYDDFVGCLRGGCWFVVIGGALQLAVIILLFRACSQ